MNIRFLKFYQSQNNSYLSHSMYAAKAVLDIGSGLCDIEFADDLLMGVKMSDIEIYDGTPTKVPTPTGGCCNKKKKKKL